MPKIAVASFHLPLIHLVGSPYKREPDDKLYWADFGYERDEFRLEELALLENGRWLQVRNVRRLTGEPFALQFKGVPEKAMVPQRRLYDAAWPVQYERKAYLVPLGAQNKRLKEEKVRLKAEVLDPEGVSVGLKWVEGPAGKALAAVTGERRFPCLIGLEYKLETDRGETLDTALLTSGAVESRDLADYVAKTFRFPGLPSVNALYSVNLRVNGWVILPPPLAAEEFEESDSSENIRIMHKALTHFTKKMRNACAQPGGMEHDALKEKMALPEAVFQMLVFRLIKDRVLYKKGDWYLPIGDPNGFLSPLAKSVLGRLETAKEAGIDVAVEGDEVFRRTLRELARMDLAVQTESPWVYSQAAWETIRKKLCGPGTLGKAWKITEVKEALDCSRKPLLGVLNLLEAEGLVQWRDDCRVVIREVEN